MALFTLKPLQQNQLSSSFTLCKYSSTFNTFKFYTFSPTKHKHTLQPPFLQVRAQVTHLETKSPSTDQSAKTHRNSDKATSSVSSSRPIDKRVDRINVKNSANSVSEDTIKKRDTKLKDRHASNKLGSERSREVGSGLSSLRSKDENASKAEGSKVLRDKMDKISKKGKNDQLGLGVEKKRRGSKKNKVDTPEPTLRIGLDMCSKRGDVMSAIRLYDLARTEGINMGQYHYAVLLYLCSSAAAGVVQPAKSGSGIRSLSTVESSNEDNRLSSTSSGLYGKMDEQVLDNEGFVESDNIHENTDTKELNTSHNLNGKQKSNLFSNGSIEQHPQTLNCMIHSMKLHYESSQTKDCGIHVGEDVKKYALERGFEIYEKMILEKVPMNEATLTSVARMAMSMGDGDMAFNMVKQMKALGINPRLRSYGPALSVFCKNGDIEKAFTVEEHMIKHGVYPEEPELEALLTVSIESGRSDKVYYLLHKLRTSVRKVSPSSADLIVKWFNTKKASRVGKIKWDKKLIKDAIESGGGGWHGQGWLGKGKWAVSRTFVGADGLCKCCGEKLVTIDLDPAETEHFAESVASIAKEREKNSSFEKFQKWLEYYGPFEAVVDAANVGLFSQRKFRPAKVKAIVNGIRPMLPSKKWPLIVLHNRRLTGDKMGEPFNKALIEKWKNADALYATPTGSNDDWYWLYAAIKCKCLLVTNDEMRDHLFQLLGNDFFPKWKERHQVRFGFSEIGPLFHMPPPCSVVIQESEKGYWHIPVVSEQDSEEKRTWLCITRAKMQMARKDFPTIHEELHLSHCKMGHASSDSCTETQAKPPPLKQGNNESTKYHSPYINRNRRTIVAPSDHHTMMSQIEAAENLGSCVIDFQI